MRLLAFCAGTMPERYAACDDAVHHSLSAHRTPLVEQMSHRRTMKGGLAQVYLLFHIEKEILA